MLDEKVPKEKSRNENVRLQNLRGFTVQILNKKSAIVGTGIAVSMDGRIVTCRHVIEDAIKNNAIEGAEVGVYFPQARGVEDKKLIAVVEKFFKDHNDDAVMLKLKDGASPLAPEQIAILGYSDYSEGNQFLSFGYSSIEPYQAIRAGGIVLGSVPPPSGVDLRVDPMQLQSRQIDEGMSGAAVLDTKRNLVIGLVAERYFPAKVAIKDDVSWAADVKILTFDPFDFELRVDPLPLQPAPSPKADEEVKKQVVEFAEETVSHRPAAEKYSWNSAPTILPEWTGRDELLAQLSVDWNDPSKHVTGLIGFGGEGKSSLARKWIETLNLQPSNLPTGIFWWGFYENRSVDEFLEAALNYLSGGRIDPRQVPSSSLRAQIIGAMLGAGRYLFVLDGLEVMQHQDGDQYGLLQSNDLRDLLSYFANPNNSSFCLITSRAPMLDLMDYTTYTHRDVDRLSEADGIALLKKLGVKPSLVIGRGQGEGNAQLAKIVADWDGHALTISLLGSYLAEKHNGDLAHLADIPIPTADEPRYQRVHRLLHRYDEHLSESEKSFLVVFSAFRLPVSPDSFEIVFLNKTSLRCVITPVAHLSYDNFQEMIQQLIRYRIIRYDFKTMTYNVHPLIRSYYNSLLAQRKLNREIVHTRISEYFFSKVKDIFSLPLPSLNDISPYIEIVHHKCAADRYDEAYLILQAYIYRGSPDRVLTNRHGAYYAAMSTLQEFFPMGNISENPLVSKSSYKGWILNEIGLCLVSLGNIKEAVEFFNRARTFANKTNSNDEMAGIYNNLTEVFLLLGDIQTADIINQKALALSRKMENKIRERNAICWLASINFLRGNMVEAGLQFNVAAQFEVEFYRESDLNVNHLISSRGVAYARYLTKQGDLERAEQFTKQNLEICKKENWVREIASCYCILANIDDANDRENLAAEKYDFAMKAARSVPIKDELIETLLWRGRFLAKHGDGHQAIENLNEALGYATEGNYRIYEADIRVALGWAWLSASNQFSVNSDQWSATRKPAKAEAERALQMSTEMGYHWGKVDAEEVLERIESSAR